MLMWSFNHDGECDPALETHRAEAMGIDTAEVRRRRQELQDRAEPQRGVDALRESFTGTAPLPGVEDIEQAARARGEEPDTSTPRPTDRQENA